MKRSCIMMLGILAIGLSKGTAQTKIDTVSNFKVQVPVQKRLYMGNGLDFAMLSTSITSRPGKSTYLTTPRFTAVVNFGFSVHYDLNEHFGLLTGIGLRNMGFIDKYGDSTIKRRVYSLGIPLGIKLGDLRNRNFLIAGGGLDIPFNYREKGFVHRGDKAKFSEWFSERTPHVMPFVFAGYSFNPGFTLKLQYYPGNFLNQDFKDDLGGKPYAGYDVHLLLLSLGIDIHYNQFRIQEREYRELKKEREQQKVL
ncbi:MAG TPA: hypothetical protein VL093_06490 [Flavipsychrobacter sp.]|nr:hypothetical protein [Flavipsychrobacter sp.]